MRSAERYFDCEKFWHDNPRAPYTFPTGDGFDVVVVDVRLGLEAVDLLRRRRMPLAPVALDHALHQAGFLLPPGSRTLFERLLTLDTLHAPEYRYLGRGSFVVLPGPGSLPSDRHQWLNGPPRHLARTHYPEAALALILTCASELLVRADCFGQIVPTRPTMVHELDTDAFLKAVDVALNRSAVRDAQ
jgi:hypothetical protein